VDRQSPKGLVDIIHSTSVNHICFTGGEPLLHWPMLENVVGLLGEEWMDGKHVHIETSGTITPRPMGNFCKLILPGYWVTCSPKLNAQDEMIKRADELKLLVDEQFDIDRLTPAMRDHRNVFVCPINDISKINHANVDRCRELQLTHPNWRISFQAHKIFDWR